MAFKPALVVVDMQNDFCPPDGSLAVEGGRDIVPLINKLLQSPSFVMKVGTRDYHPQKHISFASNHPGKQPFTSTVEVGNHVAGKPHETMQQRLWPDHCIQGTRGSELVDELDSDKFDLIVFKGMDERVEMYSAFTDSFGNLAGGYGGVSHDLAQILHEKGVTHVYSVGIAGDVCVKDTATGAAKAGFVSYIIEEAQRCVTWDSWNNCQDGLKKASVKVISMEGDEVKKVL